MAVSQERMPLTVSVRWVLATLITVATVSGPGEQTKTPPPNKELEALQAHFEATIGRRHDQLFKNISTVGQWEPRKQQIRAGLSKMLWHDLPWPDAPPTATVTDRQDHPGYTIELSLIHI